MRVHQILSDERNSIIREWKNRSGEHFFIVKKTVDNKVLFKIYSRYVRTINRHQQNIEDANIKERRTNRLKQWIMDVLCKDELTEILKLSIVKKMSLSLVAKIFLLLK